MNGIAILYSYLVIVLVLLVNFRPASFTCTIETTSYHPNKGDGLTGALANHRIDCGNYSLLQYFFAESDETGYLRYHYACCQPPASSDCEYLTTAAIDDMGLTSLTEHNITCPTAKVMKAFWMIRDRPNKMHYEYICCLVESLESCVEISTTYSLKTAGGQVKLETLAQHYVSCPSYEWLLKSYKLEESEDKEQIRYRFTCCNLKKPVKAPQPKIGNDDSTLISKPSMSQLDDKSTVVNHAKIPKDFGKDFAIPGDKCGNNVGITQRRDFYQNPADCHSYIHCVYRNETSAKGVIQECPNGLFWHDAVLQCLPEGQVPCTDRCLDGSPKSGCYAGTGCRQYFICSNTASYGMCCPDGTRFNEETCSCDKDATCSDTCVQQAPPVPTTVSPVVRLNSTVCQDSFGAMISVVPDEPNAYYLLDEFGQHSSEKMFCPPTLELDLDTCRCDIFENGTTLAPQQQPTRLAIFWASFDSDTRDHSINKFATFLYNGAERDAATGSLRINGGYMSVPGLKTFDFQNAASFCAFFKCTNNENNNQCFKSGGILSNYKDPTEFTIAMGVKPNNTLTGQVHFRNPLGTQTVGSVFQVPANGWNHVCLTYDGKAVRLYMNGVLVDTKLFESYLALSHSSFEIGRDVTLGTFDGYIDDVLVAGFAMSQEEVSAHFTTDRALD